MSPPSRAALAGAIIAMTQVAPGSLAHAGPEEEFEKAKNAYTFGDYKLAVGTLDALLNPKVRLDRAEDIDEALELLGVAAYYEGDLARSREAFTRLLSLDPDHNLDPLLVRPEVVDFFRGIQSSLRNKLEELRRKRELELQVRGDPGGDGGAGPGAVIRVRREVATPYVLNWVPFGVPQYTYGSPGWGSFFLATQAAALLGSVGGYTYRESLRGPDGAAAPGDRALAETLATLQVGTAVAFLGLAIWGAADAHLRWPGDTLILGEVQQPPPP